jgi:pimeloyl-ACP methyl ester carboxylesterase
LHTAFFSFRNHRLAYHQTGSGPETLLLFHGFGQQALVFTVLMQTLGSRYTCYAFDLFFHGQSRWGAGDRPLEKSEWRALLQAFLTQQAVDQFSVLGFSLGGKFALATAEALPGRVKSMFLLAPDGIKTSVWYSLATYPFALRRFFHSMVLHPNRFEVLAKGAFRLRLIDRSLLRFVESQMDTLAKRQLVYNAWVVFRHLKFNIPALARQIEYHGIKVRILVGEYDRVIQPQNMQPLARHASHCEVKVLPVGHNGLIDYATKNIEILLSSDC